MGLLYCYNIVIVLISNYLKYINKDKVNDIYYIKHNEDKYIIKEEDYGTTIYTKEPIDLINDINDINVEYIILNLSFTKEEEVLSILNKYLNNTKDDKEHYRGFIDRKTVYKVEDYE